MTMTPTSPSAGVAGVLAAAIATFDNIRFERRNTPDAGKQDAYWSQRIAEMQEAIRTVEAAMALPARWRADAEYLAISGTWSGADLAGFIERRADELEAALGGAAPAKEGEKHSFSCPCPECTPAAPKGGEVATVRGYRAGGSAILHWLDKPVPIGTKLYAEQPATPAGGAYDRELIARMLGTLAHPNDGCSYTVSSIDEQARLLREADNAEASRIGTVCTPAGGGDGLPELPGPVGTALGDEASGAYLHVPQPFEATLYTAEQMRSIRDSGIEYGRRLAPTQAAGGGEAEAVGEIVRLPCAEHDGYYTTVEFKSGFVATHPVGTKLYASLPAGGGGESPELPEADLLCCGTYQPAYSPALVREYGERCRLASTGSAPAPSAWRPMETAPKDGTLVFLRYGSQRPFTGSYCASTAEWLDRDNAVRMPTLWLPIPPLPAAPTQEPQG